MRARRSADNIAAVRAPVAPAPEASLDPDLPEGGLELDRVGPVSVRGAEVHQGAMRELEDLEWSSNELSGVMQSPRQEPPPAPREISRVEVGCRVVDRRAALAALAGFGEPPTALLATPAYAFRVLARRRVLMGNLEHARRYRLADAEVYEEAMACADPAAVRTGLAFVVAAIVLFAGLLCVVSETMF